MSTTTLDHSVSVHLAAQRRSPLAAYSSTYIDRLNERLKLVSAGNDILLVALEKIAARGARGTGAQACADVATAMAEYDRLSDQSEAEALLAAE